MMRELFHKLLSVKPKSVLVLNLVLISFLFSTLLMSCGFSNDKADDRYSGVLWKKVLDKNAWIYDAGFNYPVYQGTVVFHSTPDPFSENKESVLHGLSVKNGKELWRLSNKDFKPKLSLTFNNLDNKFYQYENLVFSSDVIYNGYGKDSYFYVIDIKSGKLKWMKEMPGDLEWFGNLVTGKGKKAYLDCLTADGVFTLYQVDIETGEYDVCFEITQNDMPEELKYIPFWAASITEIYKNKDGEDLIGISFCSYDTGKKAHMTLLVYNLSTLKPLFIKYINNEKINENEYDDFYGRIAYHDGKILIGKSRKFYCVDAFRDVDAFWTYKTGEYGNDNIMQVMAYNNVAICYIINNILGFDIDSGELLYNYKAVGSPIANIIDGVIYQNHGADLLMRDPLTGKELKRIQTPPNEEGFSSSRPNGANGKIFLHTYTHAYCVKAYGK